MKIEGKMFKQNTSYNRYNRYVTQATTFVSVDKMQVRQVYYNLPMAMVILLSTRARMKSQRYEVIIRRITTEQDYGFLITNKLSK